MRTIQHITAVIGVFLTLLLAILYPNETPEWVTSTYLLCFLVPYIVD